MGFLLTAACGCHTGKIRKNNEDNFFFDGKCLEETNQGMEDTMCITAAPVKGCTMAIFDGMGGERFGEVASFAAAHGLQQELAGLKEDYPFGGKAFQALAGKLNDAVMEKKKLKKT